MFNPWKDLQDLVAGEPLQAGVVLASSSGAVTVELPGGGTVEVRGTATIGATVFFRGDVIESEAVELPLITIEI